MGTLDLAMLGFIIVVAIIGIGWLIFESRSDDEKQISIFNMKQLVFCVRVIFKFPFDSNPGV